MKKKLIIGLILIVITFILGMFIYNSLKEDNKEKYPEEIKLKLKKLDYINEKTDYFKMDYLDRYLSYKEKNPNLSNQDIVVRVNIGLDKSYYSDTKVSPYLNTIYLLSNKYISMPSDYVPDSLENISESCAVKGMRLVSEARKSFEELCNDAKEEGYTIRAMSSYRSYNYQFNLYNSYVKQDGVEKADTYSARPGFSEHQTGLTVDVDNNKLSYTSFKDTKEYQWMLDNSYKYGFILRYPNDKEDITGYSYEAWHYRYVGKEIANYIHKNNITFDEYYVMFIEKDNSN